MQELYEKLAALQVDDVEGSDLLFAHVRDIAKLKHGDVALWAKLRTAWKAKGAPLLPALDKQVDAIIKEAVRRQAAKRAEGDFERYQGANGQPGSVIPNLPNTLLALDKMGVALRYDTFLGQPHVEGAGRLYDGPMQDAAVNYIWSQCELRFGFRPSMGNFRIWLGAKAFENPFHPVLDYLDGLEWDGVPRIDQWLASYCEAEDNVYTRAVGSLWLKAAVRRVRQPGCKFDELLVLESDQGADKSTLLSTIAVREEWFSDSVQLNASEKEMIESSSGVWIAEIAEMQGMRKGDVARIKAQLSRQTDRARLAYGHLPMRVPRQCVYAASMNPEASNKYLTDTTGNRRFWPVMVGRCDVEALRRDRDQLWAEASVREAAGESIRLPRELWPVAAKEQAKRMVDNAFAETLRAKLSGRRGYITAEDGWRLLGVPLTQRDANAGKFGAAWKALGWTRHNWRIDGDQTNVYAKGCKDQESGRRIVVEEGGFGAERGQMRAVYDTNGG